jgi:lysophospholipase L1-like esterase
MPNPNINRRVVLSRSAGVSYPGVEIGEVFTDTFARASLGANYTTSGASTWTTDGSKMTVTGGLGTFTHYLTRTANPTCLEKHSHTIDFKMTSAVSGTSYGIGVGVFSSNNNDRRCYSVRTVCSTGASLGKTLLDTGTGAGSPTFTNRKTSASSVVINQNDLLRLVVTRTKDVISWTMHNLTLGTSYSDSHTFLYTYASPVFVPHGGGHFSIHSLGGTFEVTNWTVTSLDKKNVKALFVGDSITYGLFAGAIADRWPDKTMLGSVNSYTVSGGSSDKTSEVLERINELILINPKYAVLMFGGNDVQFGISDITRNANHLSVVNQLKAAGITVIICYAPPRDATNLTAWNTHQQTTYGGTDVVIDVFNPLTTTPGTTTDLAAAYDPGDGVHPNPPGHALIGSTIYSAFPAIR